MNQLFSQLQPASVIQTAAKILCVMVRTGSVLVNQELCYKTAVCAKSITMVMKLEMVAQVSFSCISSDFLSA